MKTIKKSFKIFDWKLFMVIMFSAFLPTIYKTMRLFWVGTMPNSYSYSIAANMQWINVIFEVLEETFIVPLYYIFNNILKSQHQNQKIIGKITLISIIYITMILILEFFSKSLLKEMSPLDYSDIALNFIRIEFSQRLLIMLSKIGIILLIIKNMKKEIFKITIIGVALSIMLDIFLISNLKYSAKLGVMGIAIGDGIQNISCLILLGVLVYRKFEFNRKQLIPKFYWRKREISQNIFAFIESAIRNIFFIYFVIRTVNRLGNGYNQGDYWVLNSFIWQWLLIPIIALGQYVAKNSRNELHSRKEKLIAPSIIVCIVVCIWFSLLPGYQTFFKYALNYQRYAILFRILILAIPFYILFSFNELIDKMFASEGRTHLLLLQSLFTNVVVYIPYYYLVNNLNIYDVVIMFGTAISVDSLITIIMFMFLIKKEKISRNKQHKKVVINS